MNKTHTAHINLISKKLNLFQTDIRIWVVRESMLNVEATSGVHSDASVCLHGGTVAVCVCKRVQTAGSQINSNSILSLSTIIETITWRTA